jgi:hypothetical protein
VSFIASACSTTIYTQYETHKDAVLPHTATGFCAYSMPHQTNVKIGHKVKIRNYNLRCKKSSKSVEPSTENVKDNHKSVVPKLNLYLFRLKFPTHAQNADYS